MNDHAGAASNVLARQILDVSFECVLIRTALSHIRSHLRGELTVAIQHRFRSSDLFQSEAVAISAEYEAPVREVFVNAFGRGTHPYARAAPRELAVAHRRSKQILCGHRTRERGDGDLRGASQHRINAKVGTTVGRNEEGAVHVWDTSESEVRIAIVVGLVRLVLPLRRDLIVSECTIRW